MILHTTRLPRLRRWLPYIAAERHDLFDAYQSVHSPGAEATLANRSFAVSFVRVSDRVLGFVGLYRILSAEERPTTEIYADPRFSELETDFGATDTAPAQNIRRAPTQRLFRMERLDELSDLSGRLMIATPTGRNYVRIAANLDPTVLEITREASLTPPAPDWSEFVVTGAEIRALPPSWAARLREWRGIYLITDESDGARYVGAAYGEDNLLGRWRAHVEGDTGVTIELRMRDTTQFRFSILELLSPVAPAAEVTASERNWMERLHTRRFGLNV